MNPMNIVYAVAVLSVMGAVFGLLLAVASKVFYVPQDERLEPLTGCLPGANCGGCGFAGCSAYAQAVIDGKGEIGKCAAGGSETAAKMAEIMGVEAQEMEKMVAFVRCSGTEAKVKGEYYGIHDCLAASKAAGNGMTMCAYGCMGFGNCAAACQFGAMHVENGVAKVDREKCVGCMACAEACPRHLIVPVPYKATVMVPCASQDKGPVVRANCNIGCIGCTLCVKTCQFDAIHMDKGVAVVDYEKCTGCGACAEKCPRKVIVNLNGKAVIQDEPA